MLQSHFVENVIKKSSDNSNSNRDRGNKTSQKIIYADIVKGKHKVKSPMTNDQVICVN